ncbi:ABC transporter, ATPase subunit [Polymorphum gilvum SL003B-26A1]|uniref:ABC transporter, ATPase subunit n=2 Tax=Polymorphum TaxID=991903 RepID=F2J4T7_POLGS|nr:ABC transporter, ATPase subunit [Polymorphum gilvum SL003B-26A1]
MDFDAFDKAGAPGNKLLTAMLAGGDDGAMAFWTAQPDKARKAKAACDPRRADYAVFDAVRVTRGGRTVLADLSLTLSERRVAVVGLNGSGKSSFARLLNGLLLPEAGSVRVFGAETRTVRETLPRHVGFVFQNPDHQAIFPTVEEEIAFGLTQLGRERKAARAEALAFLEAQGCAGLAQKPFLDLSEGQKQLICILAVVVMQPQLLVLDEPFSSLDGLSTRRLMARLEALPQKMVMISHDLRLVQAFDRVLWLEDGRLRMDGVPGEVLPAYLADIERRAALDDGAAA